MEKCMNRKTVLVALFIGVVFVSAGQSAQWTLMPSGAGVNAGDVKTLTTTQIAAPIPPDCKMLFCSGGRLPTDFGTKYLGGFWIGETEVTYALWSSVKTWASTNGYQFQNAGATQGLTNHPASSVGWRDAVVWCNALSEMSGLNPVYVDGAGQIVRDSRNSNSNACDRAINNLGNGFRLPSEWEWECAARWQGTNSVGGAIKTGVIYWTQGTYPSGGTGASNDIALVAAKGSATSAVKSKLPNILGCYDMNGNVAEWCFGTTVSGAYVRNLRGGTYYNNSYYLTTKCRLGFFPYSVGKGTGLRLALSQSSLGNDYVVSGGAVSDPVPAPARVFNSSRCSTKIRWQDQKDSCLENPDGFPFSRKNIGFMELEQVGEDAYTTYDPSLAVDTARKNQMLYNMFQAGADDFRVHATGQSNIGMTPDFVTNELKSMTDAENSGRKVYGFWCFREDAFLFGRYDTNGNYNAAVYGEYLPPFPDIDPRIPGPKDVQNWRDQLAASDLNCKTNCKIILLLLQNTMTKLLHPEQLAGMMNGTNLWDKALPTPERAAEVLAYIRDNFDGVGEEVHIGFHEYSTNTWDGMPPVSMANYAKWCKDNGKLAFMFLGGSYITFDKGLGFSRQSYELLFNYLATQGIAPNSTNIIYFRQGGFQAINQLPEDIHDNSSAAAFSEVAWLDRRLSGPMITNTPSVHATNSLWSFQPQAACFGTNRLVWSLSNAPASMTVDASSGLMQWTPSSAERSSGQVTLTVTNTAGNGGYDSVTFEVVQPVVFHFAGAVLTSSNAVVTLPNQTVAGLPCTVKLVMTGYSATNNNAVLAKGSGSNAGALVVKDGTANDIEPNEGINVDIQVTGVSNASFSITEFSINGLSNTQRDYSITDMAGTTNGTQGAELASGVNFTAGSGVPVPVAMEKQALREGFDFAWNRVGTGGAIMGLEGITLYIDPRVAAHGTPLDWLDHFGMVTNGNYNAAELLDIDGDGMPAWQEYIAGTNPTDPASSLRIANAGMSIQGSTIIRWSSISNRFYSVSYTTNLMEDFSVLSGARNLPATPPENIYTNPIQVGGSAFYKISVDD